MLAIKYHDFNGDQKVWCPKENVSYFFHSDMELKDRVEKYKQPLEYARSNHWACKVAQRRVWEDAKLLKRSLGLVSVLRRRVEGYSLYTVVDLCTGAETPLDKWLIDNVPV